MSELRECPWCGGRAELDEVGGATGLQHFASCKDMTCPGYHYQPYTTYARKAEAIAAWNRRAPSAEETRLRAEVASLRATLGQQPAAEGAEPIGCPLPGACGAVRAHAAAFRAGAAEMRERAAETAEKAVWCPCGGPPCQTPAGHGCGVSPAEGVEVAAAIRDLPLPAVGSGWRDMTDKPTHPMPVLYWFGNRWWHQTDGTPATLDPVRDPAERTEAGWWNGEEWCETGTGHDLFEPWREERDLPTRWQPLPAAPEEGG